MLKNYVFTLDSVFKSISLRLRTDLTNQYVLLMQNILLNYVNVTLFAWKPTFLHVNHFMAWDNSLCANVISKFM